MTYYWVYMIEPTYSKKIRNKEVETSFGIPCASTEPENDLRVKLIVDSNIGFLLEFNRYSSE